MNGSASNQFWTSQEAKRLMKEIKNDAYTGVTPEPIRAILLSQPMVKKNTVGTRNKEQVGKHRSVPYRESFPYCESSSFIILNFGKHRRSVIASSCTIAESLITRVTLIAKISFIIFSFPVPMQLYYLRPKADGFNRATRGAKRLFTDNHQFTNL